MNLIYLDNAATSWPKPAETIEAINRFNYEIGVSPGRSGHRLSIESARLVYDTREAIAKLFSIEDPLNIVFTKNATEALNLAIVGFLKKGDHVITSSVEHNSVMRPLREMEKRGVEISTAPCSEKGELDPGEIRALIKKNTRAIYLTHASNVTGTILPVNEVGKIAKEHNLIFCVDSAQTCGALSIDVKEMGADMLAFSGHKSLLGPQGTGGLYIAEGLEKEVFPIILGGTGSRSEIEEQPAFMPDKYESGTLNTIGIAGLGAGVNYIISEGVEKIRLKEKALTDAFINGLKSIRGVKLYGLAESDMRTSVVSFNINNISPSEAALEFDEKYGIMSRPGLHCAPSTHRTIGTYPQGTNRFSFGYFNEEEHVIKALQAIEKISYNR